MTAWLVLSAMAGSAAAVEPSPGLPIALAAGDAQLKWGPCPPLFPPECEIAVLHGDPSAPNADVFLKVPPNYEIPPHWHTSAERMVLVTGELHVEYEGHPPSVLRPGSYAYGPARAPHQASCKAAGPCLLFIAFESAVDAYSSGGAQQ
jgi:quercetin dioxygenase-like cupin family protein